MDSPERRPQGTVEGSVAPGTSGETVGQYLSELRAAHATGGVRGRR